MEVTNRFKGLDLVERVPEELWTEVHNIVQKVVTKIIPKNMKFRKAKWLSEDALQTAKKRSKRQRRMGKIYLTECRVPETERRNKEAFLIEKRKEIEENNRMRKTADLFKKIGDTKGKFHAMIFTIKDRKSKDLTETGEI